VCLPALQHHSCFQVCCSQESSKSSPYKFMRPAGIDLPGGGEGRSRLCMWLLLWRGRPSRCKQAIQASATPHLNGLATGFSAIASRLHSHPPEEAALKEDLAAPHSVLQVCAGSRRRSEGGHSQGAAAAAGPGARR